MIIFCLLDVSKIIGMNKFFTQMFEYEKGTQASSSSLKYMGTEHYALQQVRL